MVLPRADNREDIMNIVVGYTVLVSDVDMNNNYRSEYLITGPGLSLNGENLFEIQDIEDKKIKISFIISKNKDSYDKMYKEEEINLLKSELDLVRKTLTDVQIRHDIERMELIKRKETELHNRLIDSQRSLRAIKDEIDDRVNIADNSIIINQTPGHHPNNRSLSHIDNRPLFHEENIRANESVPMNNYRVNRNENIINHNLQEKQLVNTIYEKPMLNPNIQDRPNTNPEFYPKNQTQKYNNTQDIDREMLREFMSTQKNINTNNAYDNDQDIMMEKFYEFMNKKQQQNNRYEQQDKREHDQPKVIYDALSRDLNMRDKAELISKGLLELDDKNPGALNYTFEKELQDDKKAYLISLQFLSFKPNDSITDYKQVPDKLFFRFNFWDFETFNTNIAVVSKPNSNIIPSSTPLILQRESAQIYSKSEEKEMKVEIEYDPSDDPYTDYKDFINYLLTRLLFVEVYDAEKLQSIGYIKISLNDLLRQGKPNVYHTKEYNIYDEKFNKKGALQMLIKSTGISNRKSWKYDSTILKLVNINDKNNSINKKKKLKVNPMDLDRLTEQEKEILAKEIVSNNDVKNIDTKERVLKLNVNPEIQKRLRVMKYVKGNNNVNVDEQKLTEIKKKIEKDSHFYHSLNQANKLKELKKTELISKVISDSNKSSLNVSLVSGQPHFINFVVFNDSTETELYQLSTSKGTDNNDDTIKIINNPDEWRMYTEKFKMVKPQDYKSISHQNHLIVKPNEAIPILIKVQSYNTNLANSSQTVWVYKKSGQPLCFLNITIVKVFPIIDHVFRYYLPENRYSTVKVPNPFKNDKEKTQRVLECYYSSDPSINLQLDYTTNDFYFKVKTQNDGFMNEFSLFIYSDILRTDLYASWKFVLISMAKYIIYNIVLIYMRR